jgi:hypothetical protein
MPGQTFHSRTGCGRSNNQRGVTTSHCFARAAVQIVYGELQLYAATCQDVSACHVAQFLDLTESICIVFRYQMSLQLWPLYGIFLDVLVRSFGAVIILHRLLNSHLFWSFDGSFSNT